MTRLLYQGHASVRITSNDGKVCYIDPFAGEGYERPCDLCLITHEHYDHNAVDKLTPGKRMVIIRSRDMLNEGGNTSPTRPLVTTWKPYPLITATTRRMNASATSSRSMA